MSTTKHDPFAEPRQVALYQELSSGWTRISTFYGEKDDASVHCGDVRISEPVTVTFKPLSNNEAISNAVAALDAQEKKLLADTEMALRKIREQKQNFLALTHEPEAV